jgi:hypothetical protein
MRRLLAWLGFGGFYHYVIQNDAPVSICGPYDRLRAAQGPTWTTRLYFRQEWVEFHFAPPAGAVCPPRFEV